MVLRTILKNTSHSTCSSYEKNTKNTVTKGDELARQKHNMLNINKLFKQEDVGDMCNSIGRVSSLAPSYDRGSPSYLSMKSMNRFDIFTTAFIFR